jgi:CHAT domain-containing protein
MASLTLRSAAADQTGMDFPRLPSTRLEAEAILGLVPENDRLGALGFDATRSMVMSPKLRDYRVLHFATHAFMNDDQPELSSLVLSLVDRDGRFQNGFLRLRDVYSLAISPDLVVLSACDTALGKDVKGEGMMSFVRGFMFSGAPRVVASLWKIDDLATAELMKRFYELTLKSGMTPSKALRQAQIEQMKRQPRAWPYFWAGFQFFGDWEY